MATKWADPTNWTYADYTDADKKALFSLLWDAFKGAADEKNAFVLDLHDGSFPALNQWPDLVTDNSLFIGSGTSPNNLEKMAASIFPLGDFSTFELVETDSINTSGSPGKATIIATLSYLLQTVLGYSSGSLLSVVNGLALQTWSQQWFEALDYPEYYNIPLVTGNDLVDELEHEHWEVKVTYVYDGSTFISATCLVGPVGGSTNDVYTPGDLNETAPFSTMAQVRDYAVTKLSTFTFGTPSSIPTSTAARNFIQTQHQVSGSVNTLTSILRLGKSRVKFNEAKRVTSPDTFEFKAWWNGYFNWSNDDFGTGETDDEMAFEEVTKTGDWFNLQVDGVDWTSPAIATNDGVAVQAFINRIIYDTRAVSTVIGLMAAPNQSDGTAFEYYTP